MEIKPRKDPSETMGETAVADIIIHKDDETRGANLCVLLCVDKKYRIATIYDTVQLDADQLRWLANVVDEFNERE